MAGRAEERIFSVACRPYDPVRGQPHRGGRPTECVSPVAGGNRRSPHLCPCQSRDGSFFAGTTVRQHGAGFIEVAASTTGRIPDIAFTHFDGRCAHVARRRVPTVPDGGSRVQARRLGGKDLAERPAQCRLVPVMLGRAQRIERSAIQLVNAGHGILFPGIPSCGLRRALSVGRGQPLTAPAVSPLTICRWKNRISTKSGAVAETTAATANMMLPCT